MKNILISLLLFSLVFSLALVLDMIQGLGIFEIKRSLAKFIYKMSNEELILQILFFMPLLITKVFEIIRQKNNV